MSSPEEQFRQNALRELQRREAAREGLIAFTQYTMPKYEAADHHYMFAAALEAVSRGEIDRLIITVPPRHGKSELVSKRFPAWFMGKFPDQQLVCATYGGEFAADFGREVREIVKSEEYRRLFSGVELREDSKAANRWHTTNGGVYHAVGVGGALTGKGADVLIIDDPIKDRADADSQTIREKVWAWYQSTAYTRLMPGGRIIICQTRWSEDDLTGRVLRQQGLGGDKWHVIDMPALNANGEALWPDRYPVSRLLQIKNTVGSREWNALYQQKPVVDGGNIIKSDWWKPWTDHKALPKPDMVIVSLDPAYTDKDENDPSACQVWHVFGSDDYRQKVLLRYAWAERLEFHDLITRLQETVEDGRFVPPETFFRVLVEPKASGLSIIQELRRRAPNLPVFQAPPKGDKSARAYSVQPTFEAGKVYALADDKPGIGPVFRPWAQSVIDECASFPRGLHDDQVDAMTQALRHLRTTGVNLFAEDDPPERPWNEGFKNTGWAAY